MLKLWLKREKNASHRSYSMNKSKKIHKHKGIEYKLRCFETKRKTKKLDL